MMARNPNRSLVAIIAAVGILWGHSVAAVQAQPASARYELTWFFVTMTRGGPLATRAPERTPFGTEADCAAFGSRMTPRMQDWVRGLVRADWEHPVGVRFECVPAGDPI
jgi:hypothetical protein